MKNLEMITGGMKVTLHQCMFGLVINGKGEEMPIKKPTTLLTNSPAVAARMKRTCDGTHNHGKLDGAWKTKKGSKVP